MEQSIQQLQSLGLEHADEVNISEKRFDDGGQYRIEIPSTEGPEAFRVVIEEKERLKLPVHRISQGSGIQMLSDDEISEMVDIGIDHNIEVCLFTTPRANFDIGGLWNAPVGKIIQWQSRGAEQIRYGLDDINRAVELGIRSVLISDWGLIDIVGQLRKSKKLPEDLIIKSSAIMAPANPASVALLEKIGADTVNVSTDLSVGQLSAIRSTSTAPLDIYTEAPDGLGGFVRHHETPDMIRYACPLHVKLGLRNSPDIYPAGAHIQSVALNLSRERVRRSKLVYDLIQREYPEAEMSPIEGKRAGVPVGN